MTENYRDYTTTINKEPDIPAAPVINPDVTPEPEATVEPVIGIVSGAKRLNVRSEPSTDGEVVCILPEGSKVMIDTDLSTEGWYNVYTEAGLDGYCMSDYVKIEE